MTAGKQREVYQGDTSLLAEMPVLGTDAPRSSNVGLQAHEHPSAFELCLIARGSVEWWVGREIHQVGPGEVYLTKPGERHGGVDAVLHPCELYWVLVRFGAGDRLPGLDRASSRILAQRLRKMRQRCFPGSANIRASLEQLLDEHRRRGPLSVIAARAALHTLLVTVLRDHDAHQSRQTANRSVSRPIQRALDWMQAHLDEDLAVDEWAQHAGLGVAQFHDRFRREVGFTPGDWRNRRRIDCAKHLLRRSPISITEIAYRCGYSSSQYFATAFKKQVGLSPSEYHRRVHDANSPAESGK